MGVAGIEVGVILPVDAALELPQALDATTVTVPAVEPIVMVAFVVPCPPVKLQPVPVTFQVYDVAPVAGEML